MFEFLTAERSGPRGLKGRRAYAVGDIHGRLDLLDELLGKIERDVRFLRWRGPRHSCLPRRPDRPRAAVGRRSSSVCAPIAIVRFGPLFLLGNHEEVLLRILDGDAGLIERLAAVRRLPRHLMSYGVEAGAELNSLDEQERARHGRAPSPSRRTHVEFLVQLCRHVPLRRLPVGPRRHPPGRRAPSGRSSPTCARSAAVPIGRHRPRLRRRPWPHYQQRRSRNARTGSASIPALTGPASSPPW